MIKNVGQAVSYFLGEENYYFEEGKEHSEWWGEGAKKLNLNGKIEERIFSELLKGHLPNGEQLGVKGENGEIKHRPGFDLTFSVPKSVSIVALFSDDPRIFKAISGRLTKHCKRSNKNVPRRAKLLRTSPPITRPRI